MDELIQTIRDHPDDDAPRLVWADRVGGERGEIVVLQCAIAARQGTRADRVRMQARVRELTGRKTYRRGFVEQLQVGLREVGPALLDEHPLLRELRLYGFAACNHHEDMQPIFREVVVPRLGEALEKLPICLDALDIHLGTSHYDSRGESDYAEQGALIDVVRTSKHAPTLRALRMDFGSLETPPGSIPSLEELAVNAGHLSLAQIVAMLAAQPRLSSLCARFTSFDLAPLLAAPEVQRLRSLDLRGAAQFSPDLEFGALARLGHLGIADVDLSPNLGAAFATMPSLRSLDVRQPWRRPPVRLPANDAIERLQLTRVDDVAQLIALPCLEELTVNAEPDVVARLRAHIPKVNDG